MASVAMAESNAPLWPMVNRPLDSATRPSVSSWANIGSAARKSGSVIFIWSGRATRRALDRPMARRMFAATLWNAIGVVFKPYASTLVDAGFG
jgi:hypothetical protein